MAPPVRLALEVFVNDEGTITIRQDADGVGAEEEPIVVVDPDDVSALIRALQDARRTSRRGTAEKRDEVTVPAFVYPQRPVRST